MKTLEKLLFQSKRNYFLVLLAVAVGFAQLIIHSPLPLFIQQIIFTGLPVITWIWLEKASFKALFSKLTVKGIVKAILWTFAANLLVFIVSVLYVSLVGKNNITANPIVETSLHLLNWFGIFIQLFGEEILSIALLIAIFALCRKKLTQKTSTLIATICCGIIFALLHLSTYGWNVGQVLLLLFIPRVIMNDVFLKAEKSPSIISSWLTHSLYDTLSIIASIVL